MSLNVPANGGNSSTPTDTRVSEYVHFDRKLLERTGLTVPEMQELVEIFALVDTDHGY
jgi:hypothetical protein